MSRTDGPGGLAGVEERLAGLGDAPHGMVVGATADGETRLWSRGELPDGPSSVFEIGSVTKTFTALLLASLAEDGVVALDDPVADHLPVAPEVVGRPITLEDLASHHSGLPRLPRGTAWTGLTRERRDPYARFDEPTLVEALRRTPPTRAPGEKFTYSNLGAGLLGWALARAAGTTYDALLADRVTGPLGLVDTTVGPAAHTDARFAQGHGWWGRPAGPWDLALLAGAGGIRSTATDLLRYLAVFTDASVAAGGVLATAAAETRRQRHSLGRVMRADVGLGWLVMPDGPLFHDGGTGGYRSFAAVDPVDGTAVVVLSARGRSVTGLGLQLLATARRRTMGA